MALIHAVNGISHIVLVAICFYALFHFIKKDEGIKRIGRIIGTAGVFHLLMASLNFLWLFSIIRPNDLDFLLLNTIMTVVTSFLVTYLIFKITSSKSIIYMLVLYITVLFAANYSLKAFLIASDAVSYLLLSIVFVELASRSKGHMRKAGDMGIVYCTASVLASMVYFFDNSHKSLWFIPTLMIGLVYLHIFKAIKGGGLVLSPRKFRSESGIEYFKVLARFLVFMVSITAFILISTISLHELGHAFVAQFYGCSQYKAVIYDIVNPHTEIVCSSYYNDLVITLAGLMATIAIALIFMLTGMELTFGISYLMAGFGLMISYGDLLQAGTSINFVVPIMIFSFIMIVIGIVKISTNYLRQQEIFKETR
jgi:hypothetical protein